MQIVIDVDDEFYDAIKDGYIEPCDTDYALSCVLKGTPLPEHHGRLADLDAALKCVEEVTDSKEKKYAIALFDWAMSKRVIIPATKEGDEK